MKRNLTHLSLSHLSSKHYLDTFDSGVDVIDRQIKDYLAFPPPPEHISVIVATYPNRYEIMGYMALRLASHLDYRDVPKTLKLPFLGSEEPVLEIAFIGITRALRGMKEGLVMVQEAFILAKEAGYRLLSITAVNDTLVTLYTSYGFMRVGHSMRLLAMV